MSRFVAVIAAVRPPRSLVELSLLTIIFFVLSASFGWNAFRVVDHSEWQGFKVDAETLVIGSLDRTRTHGFADHWGALGTTVGNVKAPGSQEAVFGSPGSDRVWQSYNSHFGAQAIVLAALDRITRADPAVTLEVFQKATALALAAIIVFISARIGRCIGWLAALGFGAGAFASQWLTLLAPNLYWAPYTYFLPLAAAFVAAESVDERGSCSLPGVILLFCAFFFRFACNYEFITTVTLSAVAAPILVGASRGWASRRLLGMVVLIGVTALAAFLLVVALHGWRSDSIGHVISQAIVRTHGSWNYGSADGLRGWLSAQAPLWTTLGSHLFGEPQRIDFVRMGFVVLPVLLLCAIALASPSAWLFGSRAKQVEGLALATLIGGLGAVSWYFGAKAHSYGHPHVVPVVWSVPFLPLAASLIGGMIGAIYSNAQVLRADPSRTLLSLGAISTAAFVLLLPMVDGLSRSHELQQLVKRAESGFTITEQPEHGVRFLLSDGMLAATFSDCSHHGVWDQFSIRIASHSGVRDWTVSRATHGTPSWAVLAPLAGCRMFVLDVPADPARIDIGHTSREGKLLWQTSIDVDALLPSSIPLADITDANWDRGAFRRSAGVLVAAAAFRAARIGPSARIEGRTIRAIEHAGPFVRIWLEGAPLAQSSAVSLLR